MKQYEYLNEMKHSKKTNTGLVTRRMQRKRTMLTEQNKDE